MPAGMMLDGNIINWKLVTSLWNFSFDQPYHPFSWAYPGVLPGKIRVLYPLLEIRLHEVISTWKSNYPTPCRQLLIKPQQYPDPDQPEPLQHCNQELLATPASHGHISSVILTPLIPLDLSSPNSRFLHFLIAIPYIVNEFYLTTFDVSFLLVVPNKSITFWSILGNYLAVWWSIFQLVWVHLSLNWQTTCVCGLLSSLYCCPQAKHQICLMKFSDETIQV